MGATFRLAHANLVAYLTSGDRQGPTVQQNVLTEFLMYISDGSRGDRAHLISGGGSWAEGLQRAAARAVEDLFGKRQVEPWGEQLVGGGVVTEILSPLREYFSDFLLYAMIVPGKESAREDGAVRDLFETMAMGVGQRGLVLLPEDQDDLVEIVEPFRPMAKLVETPVPLPAVLLWTREGKVSVESVRGPDFRNFLDRLFGIMQGGRGLDGLFDDPGRKSQIIKILQMSDLHFGRNEATQRRRYLKAQLTTILDDIDRVVITGDLFDEPKEEYRAEFDEFRADVERMTGHDLIVVPGNHDVRRHGNRIAGLGEDFTQLARIDWDSVVVDDDNRTVFFCFNSAETGRRWARGGVGETQRRDVATRYLEKQGRNPGIRDYLKMALVHHHPYPYATPDGKDGMPLYQKVVNFFWSNEDKFLEFENSGSFMKWCSERGVEVVMHGHKHRPRMLKNQDGILVVGCGSTTGTENTPMAYNIISRDTVSGRWNPSFYADKNSDGGGFKPLLVQFDNV